MDVRARVYSLYVYLGSGAGNIEGRHRVRLRVRARAYVRASWTVGSVSMVSPAISSSHLLHAEECRSD